MCRSSGFSPDGTLRQRIDVRALIGKPTSARKTSRLFTVMALIPIQQIYMIHGPDPVVSAGCAAIRPQLVHERTIVLSRFTDPRSVMSTAGQCSWPAILREMSTALPRTLVGRTAVQCGDDGCKITSAWGRT